MTAVLDQLQGRQIHFLFLNLTHQTFLSHSFYLQDMIYQTTYRLALHQFTSFQYTIKLLLLHSIQYILVVIHGKTTSGDLLNSEPLSSLVARVCECVLIGVCSLQWACSTDCMAAKIRAMDSGN